METFRTGSVTGCNGKNVTLPVARPQIDTPNSTRESIRNNQQQGRGGGEGTEGLQFRFIIRVSNSTSIYPPEGEEKGGGINVLS